MTNYTVTGNPSYFNQDVTFATNITVGQNIFGNVTGTFKGSIVGNTAITGNLTANQYIVSAGASNQFLKANGTLDSTTYLTAATVGGISENVQNTIIQRNGLGGFSAGITTLGNTVVGGGTTQLVVQGNTYFSGSVGIGTASPSQVLHAIGNILASGTVTANSDFKLKTNIQTIPNALQKVIQLRGVEYDRIDMGEHQIGVIAQEVEKIIPEVVMNNNGTKSVAYGNLVGLLIEAIKEQQKEIEILKNIINSGKVV
jgi:Chaperone of endosialidase